MSSGPFFAPSVIPNNTQGALTLYVSPTGSDANLGTDPAFPLRQPNTALDRLRAFDKIRHLMTIDVAAGSYDGYSVQGLHFDFVSGSSGGLFIKGALAVTTELTQSTPTGTITSSVTGNAASAQWTQVTDNTKNWVANQLKGKFARWTVAGTTTISVIMENDATSFKPATAVAAPSNGTAYEICDAACVINGTPVQLPGSLATLTAAATTPAPCQIAVTGNVSSPFTTSIRIEGFRVNVPTPASNSRGIFCDTGGGVVAFGRCQVDSMATGVPINFFGSGTVALTSVAALSGASSVIFAGSATTSIAPSISASGVLLSSASITMNLGAAHGQGVTLINCSIEGPIGINVVGFCNIGMTGIVRFINGSSQAFRARASSSGIGGCFVQMLAGGGYEMVGRSVGIELNGAHQVVIDGNLILSGCTRGVVCERGAKCQVSAGSTMTTVTTELSTDEITGTLAAMRAASPKVQKSSNYFSVIYE